MALSASAIIEQLKQGRTCENLKTKVSWKSLSADERTMLLKQTGAWQEVSAGLELLRLLYATAPTTEYSFRLKTLSRVILRQDAQVDKSKLLKSIKSLLDSWRDALKGSSDTAQVRLYRIAEGDYAWLCGYVYEENQEYDNAGERYQAALTAYQELDHQNGTQLAAYKLDGLKSREPDAGAIPLEVLLDRRTVLEAEIGRLTDEVSGLQRQLDVKQTELDVQHRRVQELEQRASQLSDELDRHQEDLRRMSREMRNKEKQTSALESALHFLMVLPQVAMAPLWLEVVRLALDKGEIDAFTVQALERLAVSCADEALPLIAEIAARCPEPFTVDTGQFVSSLSRWFALIAEARTLQPSDEMAAAQKMVEAWDTFLAMDGNGGAHG